TSVIQQKFTSSCLLFQIENLTSTTNVTVGYYAISDRTVYIASVVVEALNTYGYDKLMSDIKQYVSDVQSIQIPATPWIPSPAIFLQLKTVLRFVGPTDNIKSCSFVQTMEQRLQNAFAEAESKVLNSQNHLSVQILSTSQAVGSPAVTLIYFVRNQSVILNGTVSSNLLNQLTAELVGYFLHFPPLIIAEPLEYHNLNTSQATRDYWVITVIQDVDNSSLEVNYQSFASLMEQRLAELFVIAGQQGRRFRRATTVGSYTVQMVNIKRIPGPKNPAEMTYYVLSNGTPLPGTTAAKILNTVDSQTMALTLGYFVQLQAEPVVKNPPNNLWIIAAVLTPIAVVTIIIIIIAAVLCRKNKSDFKADTMGNLHPRAKPVQGFDYAKQHLGQQGGEDEAIPVTQETVVLPLPVRDAPLSQERGLTRDGSPTKKTLSREMRKSRLPSEDGSVISTESGKLNSGRGSAQKVTAQQKMTKEELRKRNAPMSDEEEGAVLFDRVSRSSADPFDTSSGSLQLISIKPLAVPPSYSHPSSDRSQDSVVINGEVNMALKQKSDIEHYRNKLRLKAKRKGYYDFPAIDSNSKSITHRQKQEYEKAQMELNKVLDPDEEISSTYVKSRSRQSQTKNPAYRSRQSLNSPSPGGTEMDLLVTRDRPRRGIRNSGYDTEPELIEETNVDRAVGSRGYTRSRQVKGHSETSTLSSQPSIDEVRQQMHLLLEEAFSLASAGHTTNNRLQGTYSPGQQIPYSEVVTSAPGTMNRPRAGVQWMPAYGPDVYQYSLPRPAFRFTQLPDMAMGSPPPPIPPRTGPAVVTSLRRSSSDIGAKNRTSESAVPEQQSQHDSASYVPITRAPVPSATVEQPISNYSGNPAPAVYAIPANRPGYTGYFIPTPPAPYRSQTWMPYPPEGDVPNQWAESVPLPGYVEAYPHSRYQQPSPPRVPRHYSQASPVHRSLEHPPTPSTAASQQSLTENDASDPSLTNISTAALVKAIREEVAKLAKKQTDMFEFQV
ncbi:K154L protein, partial [Amia calva]|nr:K154L protein [Amia calva]